MNVTELARRLKIQTQELREKLPLLGFDIGMKAIQIDDRMVPKIQAKWNEYRREAEKVQEAATHAAEVAARVEEQAFIMLPAQITVSDLAEKIKLPVTRVIKELMKNGIIASINEKIDFETASIILNDLGFQVQKDETDMDESEETRRREKLKGLLDQDQKHLVQRPPIIVVMGHVDHGKTSLLDAIRNTNITASESGGITQNIGAYQVEKNGQLITFIDTPGHEAFKSMRMRGGLAADLAILLIAADDHIQPQTLESIKIIQEENLPFVVAINKIDKDDADLDLIKKELSEINLIPEDWGGPVTCVPVSAKSGQGIDELLDMVLLVSEMHKDLLMVNPEREAVGTIIESRIDKEAGPVATVLVHTGTLRVGDSIIVGNTFGKIRAMKDWRNNLITEAAPSMPARFIGFKTAPKIGDVLEVVNNPKEFKNRIKNYKLDSRVEKDWHNIVERDNQGQVLNIVLKADVLGSLEAVVQSLEKIKSSDAGVKVIKRGLGDISESDVAQAESSQALLIAFNTGTANDALLSAKEKNIEIRDFKIIYELLDYVKQTMLEKLAPEVVRTDIGSGKVLAIFRTEKDAMIIGVKVNVGHVTRDSKIEIYRDEELITKGKIDKLQCNKEEVKDVENPADCGIHFVGQPLIQVGDKVNFYREEKKARTID